VPSLFNPPGMGGTPQQVGAKIEDGKSVAGGGFT